MVILKISSQKGKQFQIHKLEGKGTTLLLFRALRSPKKEINLMRTYELLPRSVEMASKSVFQKDLKRRTIQLL